MFAGSYRQGDVEFLLKQLDMMPIADLEEKEHLIQSGQRHYSEVVGVEQQPSAEYLLLFHAAVDRNARAMAIDLVRLARTLLAARTAGLTLVSLARAGTPIGVLLRHVLAEHFAIDVPHYSISIIRDRGIDANALDYICARHPPKSLAFIDGWTGKGAIARELTRSIRDYRESSHLDVSDELYVLCDLAGYASGSGSTADYLIPSAILNSTVSGLVSRSILNDLIGPHDFHGCLYHHEFGEQDRSQWFVDRLLGEVREVFVESEKEPLGYVDREALRVRSETMITEIMHRFDVTDRNYVKPGIGEATRSLLRRTPRALLLRDPVARDVQHLALLARERGVQVHVDSELPLQAISIIRKLSDA